MLVVGYGIEQSAATCRKAITASSCPTNYRTTLSLYRNS